MSDFGDSIDLRRLPPKYSSKLKQKTVLTTEVLIALEFYKPTTLMLRDLSKSLISKCL